MFRLSPILVCALLAATLARTPVLAAPGAAVPACLLDPTPTCLTALAAEAAGRSRPDREAWDGRIEDLYSHIADPQVRDRVIEVFEEARQGGENRYDLRALATFRGEQVSRTAADRIEAGELDAVLRDAAAVEDDPESRAQLLAGPVAELVRRGRADLALTVMNEGFDRSPSPPRWASRPSRESFVAPLAGAIVAEAIACSCGPKPESLLDRLEQGTRERTEVRLLARTGDRAGFEARFGGHRSAGDLWVTFFETLASHRPEQEALATLPAVVTVLGTNGLSHLESIAREAHRRGATRLRDAILSALDPRIAVDLMQEFDPDAGAVLERIAALDPCCQAFASRSAVRRAIRMERFDDAVRIYEERGLAGALVHRSSLDRDDDGDLDAFLLKILVQARAFEAAKRLADRIESPSLRRQVLGWVEAENAYLQRRESALASLRGAATDAGSSRLSRGDLQRAIERRDWTAAAAFAELTARAAPQTKGRGKGRGKTPDPRQGLYIAVASAMARS